MYTYIHTHTHTHIYIYIHKERERDRVVSVTRCSFHLDVTSVSLPIRGISRHSPRFNAGTFPTVRWSICSRRWSVLHAHHLVCLKRNVVKLYVLNINDRYKVYVSSCGQFRCNTHVNLFIKIVHSFLPSLEPNSK